MNDMTWANSGKVEVEVSELLASLAAAERHVLDSAESADRSSEYRVGVVDAFADVQALVRKLAGWPLEGEPDRIIT